MARRVSLPSADDLFRATEEEKARGTRRGGRGATPYPTSRSPTRRASPAAGSSTTRR